MSEPFEQRLEQIDPAADLERADRLGIRFVMPGDDEWLCQLADLEACDPLQERGGEPIGLWVKGDLDLAEITSSAVAVVGSRAATTYGEHQARTLSTDLAGPGRTLVSGAAFGIDQAAHPSALSAGGPSRSWGTPARHHPCTMRPPCHRGGGRCPALLPVDALIAVAWRGGEVAFAVGGGGRRTWANLPLLVDGRRLVGVD